MATTYPKQLSEDVTILSVKDDIATVRLVKRDKDGQVVGEITGTFPFNAKKALEVLGEAELMNLAFDAWKIRQRAKVGTKASGKSRVRFAA